MPDDLRVLSLALESLAQRENWKPFREGVEVSWVYGEGSSGASAALLRYAKGAHVPAHRHQGYEHVLVLEGEQRDKSGVYPRGTLIVNQPGTEHEVWSPEGCLVLVIWERRVKFASDA